MTYGVELVSLLISATFVVVSSSTFVEIQKVKDTNQTLEGFPRRTSQNDESLAQTLENIFFIARHEQDLFLRDVINRMEEQAIQQGCGFVVVNDHFKRLRGAWSSLSWNGQVLGNSLEVIPPFTKTRPCEHIFLVLPHTDLIMKEAIAKQLAPFNRKFVYLPLEYHRPDLVLELFAKSNLYDLYLIDPHHRPQRGNMYLIRYACLYCRDIRSVNGSILNNHEVRRFAFLKGTKFPRSFDGNGRGGKLQVGISAVGASWIVDTSKVPPVVSGMNSVTTMIIANKHNFKVDYRYAPDGFGIKLHNSTGFNGVAGYLQRREVDMVQELIITHSNIEIATLSSAPFQVTSIGVTMETPKLLGETQRWQDLFWHLSPAVWIAIWAAAVGATVALYLIIQPIRFSKKDYETSTKSIPHSWGDAIFTMIKILLRQDTYAENNKVTSFPILQHSSRTMLMGVCYWLLLVIVCVYSCNLTSQLASPARYHRIETMEQLEKSGRVVIAPTNSRISVDIFLSHPKIIAQMLLEPMPDLEDHLVTLLLNPGKFAIYQPLEPNIMFVNTARKQDNVLKMKKFRESTRIELGDWPYYFSKPFGSFHRHMLFSKHSPLAEKLDKTIIRMVETGIYQQNLNNLHPYNLQMYTQKEIKRRQLEENSLRLRSLSLNQFYGAFGILLGGQIAGFLSLVLEVLKYKLKKMRKVLEENELQK